MTESVVQSGAIRLSPQQQTCLRMVWQLRSSKEIAIELGISKSTVDGYLAEAVKALGARNRRDAAALCFGAPPVESGGVQTRVSSTSQPAEPVPVVPSSSSPWWERFAWPVQTRWRPDNDLSIPAILIWIGLIAVGSLAIVGLTVSIAGGLATAFPPRHLPSPSN